MKKASFFGTMNRFTRVRVRALADNMLIKGMMAFLASLTAMLILYKGLSAL